MHIKVQTPHHTIHHAMPHTYTETSSLLVFWLRHRMYKYGKYSSMVNAGYVFLSEII